MAPLAAHDLQHRLDSVAPDAARTSRLVDVLLEDAVRRGASDVHVEPTSGALEVRYRLDGVLVRVASLGRELAPNVVARLKVLAELLTYRPDVPQEGRVEGAVRRYGADMRVSTFPTVHGEKAVVRVFDATGRVLDLDELGLPPAARAGLAAALRERTGAVLLTGPSGSGKTTTIYACLRHVVRAAGGARHVVTIEEPVEQVIEGVSQSQARQGTEFDFARGLRSLLRQDPEVIMIGEVRDADTAGVAVEAALTGHLVFTTLHAGSACGVVGRLLDMGVEPYLLTSGVRAILNQRLLRRLCADCRRPAARGWAAVGCPSCAGTGYRGRLLLAEYVTLEGPLRRAVLARADTSALEEAVAGPGRESIRDGADRALEQGLTSAEEIERVLGPRPPGTPA